MATLGHHLGLRRGRGIRGSRGSHSGLSGNPAFTLRRSRPSCSPRGYFPLGQAWVRLPCGRRSHGADKNWTRASTIWSVHRRLPPTSREVTADGPVDWYVLASPDLIPGARPRHRRMPLAPSPGFRRTLAGRVKQAGLLLRIQGVPGLGTSLLDRLGRPRWMR